MQLFLRRPVLQLFLRPPVLQLFLRRPVRQPICLVRASHSARRFGLGVWEERAEGRGSGATFKEETTRCTYFCDDPFCNYFCGHPFCNCFCDDPFRNHVCWLRAFFKVLSRVRRDAKCKIIRKLRCSYFEAAALSLPAALLRFFCNHMRTHLG